MWLKCLMIPHIYHENRLMSVPKNLCSRLETSCFTKAVIGINAFNS
jgi:hypothetical protein